MTTRFASVSVMTCAFCGKVCARSLRFSFRLRACSARNEFTKMGGILERVWEGVEEGTEVEEVEEEEEEEEGSSNRGKTGTKTESGLRAERSYP
jgi:hypothetical protein